MTALVGPYRRFCLRIDNGSGNETVELVRAPDGRFFVSRENAATALFDVEDLVSLVAV